MSSSDEPHTRSPSWVSGVWGVFVFRAIRFPMLRAQMLMGVLRVPIGRLVVGTLIGFAPSVAFDVWLGGELLKRLLAWLGLG